MNHSFHSRWRRELGEFIAFRRTYFTSVWPAQQLRRFDAYAAPHPHWTLPEAIAQWLKCGPHRHPITRSNDLTAIRQFCLYRRRFDPDGFVPDRIEPVSAVRRRFQACILRPEQVQLLLRNIRTLQGPPLRLARLRALFLVQNPHRNTNEALLEGSCVSGLHRGRGVPDRSNCILVGPAFPFLHRKLQPGSACSGFRNGDFHVVEAPPDGIEKDCFGPDGLPPHQSWANARGGCWAEPASESWTEYSKAPALQIELSSTGECEEQVSCLSDTLVQRLRRESALRQGPVIWRCEGAPGGDDSLGLFCDGTRRWPCVIDDLARGLALTAVFAALVGKSEAHSNYPDVAISLAEECLGDECVEVEIGMSDGSYTRGLARSSELQKAIRSDFSIWLKESWRPQITTVRDVIQVANVPECVFDFEALTRIFVREIVPTQVVLRGEHSGKARMYNIAHDRV